MLLSRRKKILFVFAALVIWIGFAVFGLYRAQDGSNDFDTFYAAGKSVLTKTGIYYAGDYYQMPSGIGPFLYPPVTACFFSLFALFPMPVAAVLWVALLLILFGASIFLTFKFLGIRDEEFSSFFKATSLKERIFLFVIGAIFLIDNLVMMQINILVLFLCVWCVLLWRGRFHFLAGVVLSAAIFLKLTPVLFCLYFLVKKSWNVIAGVLIGSFFLAAVIPTLIFGLEQNRIYHRQWLGRMIKPALIDVIEKIKPEDPHVMKKSAGDMRSIAISGLLVDTNQSLSAALTRLFLKDRNQYQVTHRYQQLPVIGGGIPAKWLGLWLILLRVSLLGICIYFWTRPKNDPHNLKIPLEISLLFLTMTLLSPITRSHYYVVWIFVYLTLFLVQYRLGDSSRTKFFFAAANLSASIYMLLAVPYGEAVGMGAWANLIFWIGCIHQLQADKA